MVAAVTSLSVSIILDSSSLINLQLDGREIIVPAQDSIKTFTPDFEGWNSEATQGSPALSMVPLAPRLSHPPISTTSRGAESSDMDLMKL